MFFERQSEHHGKRHAATAHKNGRLEVAIYDDDGHPVAELDTSWKSATVESKVAEYLAIRAEFGRELIRRRALIERRKVELAENRRQLEIRKRQLSAKKLEQAKAEGHPVVSFDARTNRFSTVPRSGLAR